MRNNVCYNCGHVNNSIGVCKFCGSSIVPVAFIILNPKIVGDSGSIIYGVLSQPDFSELAYNINTKLTNDKNTNNGGKNEI